MGAEDGAVLVVFGDLPPSFNYGRYLLGYDLSSGESSQQTDSNIVDI